LSLLFVNYCIYVQDPAAVSAIRPSHREYIARLSDEGKIVAAGPLADGTGGLFIYSAKDEEEARTLAKQDPYSTMGALASSTLICWTPVNVKPDLLVAG
jgi:uncharacterized protein YciI